jgi:hypothetical protein
MSGSYLLGPVGSVAVGLSLEKKGGDPEIDAEGYVFVGNLEYMAAKHKNGRGQFSTPN